MFGKVYFCISSFLPSFFSSGMGRCPLIYSLKHASLVDEEGTDFYQSQGRNARILEIPTLVSYTTRDRRKRHPACDKIEMSTVTSGPLHRVRHRHPRCSRSRRKWTTKRAYLRWLPIAVANADGARASNYEGFYMVDGSPVPSYRQHALESYGNQGMLTPEPSNT